MPSLGKRALRPPTRPGAWAAPAAFAAAAADFPRGMRTVRRVRGTGRIQRLLDGHAACCFFSLSCDSLGANSVLGASGAVVVCVCAARKMLRSELRDQTCPVCRLHRLIFSHIAYNNTRKSLPLPPLACGLRLCLQWQKCLSQR